MNKNRFLGRFELFLNPLERLHELKLEPPKEDIKKESPNNDAVVYKRAKRRKKMSCGCKNCTERRTQLENTKNQDSAKYDSKGFAELEDGLSLLMLKGSSKPSGESKENDDYKKIFDNIAANVAYCNDIMKAEMDKLGIKDLSLADKPKPSKEQGQCRHVKPQKKEEIERNNCVSEKSKRKVKVVLILEPSKPKESIQKPPEPPKEEPQPEKPAWMLNKYEAQQVILLFKQADARKKYKRLQKQLILVQQSGTRKQFMDLQMKLFQAKIEIERIKLQMSSFINY